MRDRRTSPRLPSVPSYPDAPPGWTAVRRRKVGPFTTHVTYRRADGGTTEWRSRAHRKRASLLSRSGRSGWWAPGQASFWIGALFAVGSACFVVAPFPGFVSLVGAAADAAVFFAGSLFFTTAAALQYLEAVNADRGPAGHGARRRLRVFAFEPRRIDWWATTVQLAGTLLFNLSTFGALQTGLSTAAENRVIWAPDVFGCIAFLVASALAWAEVCGGAACRPRRELEWWIAAVNLGGSVLDLAAANFMTVVGALGFLAGALLLLREGASARITPPLVPARA
jgi:hypothetical protein